MRWMRKLWALLRLSSFTVWELVISNVDVALTLLRPRHRLHPRIIRIPIREASDASITTLANLITLTPGTLTVEVAPERDALFVHALNAQDEELLRKQVQQGFEARVREVFE